MNKQVDNRQAWVDIDAPADASTRPLVPSAERDDSPPIRRAGGGLRFLGALLLFATLSLLSCQSLFVL